MGAHEGLDDRIVRDPEIMVGKPTVRGTRLTVEFILAWLAENPNVDELVDTYDRLTRDDVRACLAFAERQVRRAFKPPWKERSTAPSSQ